MLNQIKIQSVHYDLSETSETFIKEKLTKLDYLKPLLIDGIIRIIRENEEYKVEADVHLKTKQKIHIATSASKLYPAVENLMHKLKHKLSEEHKKITSHHQHHEHSIHHADGQPFATPETPSEDETPTPHNN